MLPGCGHTLCLVCLSDVLKKQRICPLDRVKLEDHESHKFPTNQALLQIVDEKSKIEYGSCKEHGKPKSFVCLKERRWICEECKSEHKNHEIKCAKELECEARDKRKKMEILVEEIIRTKEDVEIILKDAERSLNMSIKTEFDLIRDVLKTKERDLLSESESFFENKKAEIMKKDDMIKNFISMIADLDDHRNENFLKTFVKFDEVTPSFRMENDIHQAFKRVEEVEKQYITTLQTLRSSLIPQILKIKFPDMIDTSIDNNNDNTPNVLKKVDKHIDLDDLTRLFEIQFPMKLNGSKAHIIAKKTSDNKNNRKDPVLNINQFRNINRFVLDFKKADFTEQHFQAFKQIHSHCENISQLEINLSNKNFTNENLIQFSSDLFWATNGIKHFVLDVKSSQVSDTSVVSLLTNIFPGLNNVIKLELDFSSTAITDQTIFALSSQIIKAKNFSVFNLEIKKTDVTDTGLIALWKALRPSSKTIDDLRLGLSETLITDKTVQMLEKEVLWQVVKIHVFQLSVNQTHITDQGFEDFLENAKTKIISFTLNMQGTQITEKTVVYFKNIFPTMKALRNVQFYFYVPQIPKQHSEKLYQEFKSLFKNMDSFKLSTTK